MILVRLLKEYKGWEKGDILKLPEAEATELIKNETAKEL